MKRPERIRILGKRFTVVYGATLDDGLVGECDSDGQRISIRDGQPLESEQDTLLHEVCHAVDDAMDCKLKETQVKKLATGLLAVLRDNPHLSAYLRRKYAESRD